MAIDDRFDDLVASLGGFYRTWLIYLGVDLGLFRRLRDAGRAGITPADLARAAGCAVGPIEEWALGVDAHGLATFEDGRLTI